MDENREEGCEAPLIPASLSEGLSGYIWALNTVGKSGATIHRLHSKPGAPDLYLKHGCDSVAADLLDEVVRLRWLAGHVSVPAVRHFISTPAEAWLLVTALPGKTAYQSFIEHPEDSPAIVDALADFLQKLHAIPIGTCPFTSDHSYRLGLARIRIEAGLVDHDDFDDERRGWTAENVWQAMLKHLPFTNDPVVTHGDYSLDNMMVVDGQVIGCLDVGRVGIADRYQDLAILLNSLDEFEESLRDRFLTQYGEPKVDQGKLMFHLMLDELF